MTALQSSQFVALDAEPRPLALSAGEPVPALELYNIVKSWRGPGLVLDDVELVVEPGAAVQIVGRNGSGKTTLLRVAVGLIKPESGIVSSAGLHPDLNRREYQRRIGFLAAGDRALYARMTVRDHLRFWSRLKFVPRSEERAAIEGAIHRFGLEELADRRVDRISMGQRQRARLAGAFLHEPDVVLLDEPRNSLDHEGVAVLVDWLNSVVERGGSVVWSCPTGEGAELDFTARYVLDAHKLIRA